MINTTNNSYKIKNLYIHIGRHKSASTSIQAWLLSNKDYLKQRGILYSTVSAKISKGRFFACHNLAALCNDITPNGIEKLKEAAKIILQEIQNSDCYSLILSSEGFQNIKDMTNINFLIDFLAPEKVKVICIFREFLDYAVSAYRQRIHNRIETVTFCEHLKSYSKGNIELFHKQWSSIGDFHGLILSQYNAKGNDLFKKFEELLEINDSASIYLNDQKNISIGGDLLAYKILINHEIKKSQKEIGMGMYNKLENFAAACKEFSLPFFIEDKLALDIQKNSNYNYYIQKTFGKLVFKSWSNYEPIPSSRFEKNLDIFNFFFSDLIENIFLKIESKILLSKYFSPKI